MKIGERIRQRRKEIGLSVDELAEILGKNRATVYRYESNEIEKLLSEYATLSAAEKNSLLCSCVRKITYYRDKSNRYDQKPVSMEIELKV